MFTDYILMCSEISKYIHSIQYAILASKKKNQILTNTKGALSIAKS